ncbi:MAG TPA: TolC family protein [Phycisphaerales bacterium]|nr:TolC family protein [Phycisphaerales bacterium]HMP37580.1 TolC family protein [Phycisphaerales bacterium]
MRVAAALALVAAAGHGCRNPLDMGPVSFDREALRSAEEVDLGRLSRKPPTSVEDATAEVLRDVISPAPAPARVELTLAEVRAAALAGNLELRAELFNPTIAATVVDEEEAKFEWTFFANAARARTDRPTPTLLEAAQSDLNTFNLGVNVPLRTGGQIVVDVPFQDLETSDPFALLNPSYDASLRFAISQPLLRNAGVRTNTNSIRVAGYQSQIVDARTKLSAIRILAEADKSYWRLFAARGELSVRQQRYELAVEQLERARRLVAAGNAAEVEIIRSQQGVADSLTGIIVAETAVRVRQRELKRIMNREDLPPGGATEVIPATDPSPVGLDLDAEALAGRAVTNRMEMVELELQLAIDASNLDFQRNQALPLFVVDYLYSRDGLGERYGKAFSQLTDQSFENWRIAARLEIPLGNEAAKARVHRAILTRVQRLATRDQRRQAIREEVFDALDLLQESWQRILAARQQTIVAARTFEAERRQFELGLRTSTDVLDAAARLSDAQSQEVRALAEYQIAQVDIAFATGTLLGNGRVHWTPSDAR